MTVPEREVESRTEPATSVELLLRTMHRLEQQPLEVQVDLLETVGRGLDAVLAQPVHQPVHQPAPGASDRPDAGVPQPSTGHG